MFFMGFALLWSAGWTGDFHWGTYFNFITRLSFRNQYMGGGELFTSYSLFLVLLVKNSGFTVVSEVCGKSNE